MDEQKINDLIYEIQILVSTLSKGSTATSSSTTTTSNKGMTDKSATQLIAALGVLASKLGGAARNRKEEIRAANDFANSVTVAANRAEKAAEKQAKKSEDFANAAAANAEQLRRASLSAKQIAQDQANANKQSIVEANRLKNATDNLKRGMDDAYKSIASLVANTQASTHDYASAMSSAATPVLKFASLMGGPVTKGLSFFGQALIQWGVAAAKQADQQFKAFDRLAKVGGSSIGSLRELYELTKSFNYTSNELDKLGDVLVANSDNIALLGKGFTDGSKGIGKVMSQFSAGADSFREQFRALGMAYESQNEALMGYAANEARLGRARQLQDKNAGATFAEYLKNVEAITRLTGADRAKQEAAQAKTLAKEQFRVRLEQAKAPGGDPKELARLTKIQEAITLASASGAEDVADQLRALAGGFIGAKGGEGITQLLGGEASAMLDSLDENTDALAFVKNLLAKTTQAQIGAFGTLGRVGGLESQTGIGVGQTADAAARLGDEKTLAAIRAKIEEQLRSPDPILRTKAETDKATLEKGQNLQDFIQVAIPAATTATNIFARALSNATEFLATKKDSALTKSSDDANYKAMGLIDKSFSLVARGLENVADIVGLDYVASQARGNRIENEGRYFKDLVSRKSKAAQEAGVESGLTQEQIAAAAARSVIENAPKYATGGIASGPGSGHLAMLHGTEAVIPLAGGGIPVKLSGGGGIESGPVFNPQTETNFLLEKNNEELVKANVTLSQMLEAITGGATVTGGGGGGGGTSEKVAQEALAEHDHAHPHEPAAAADPELAKQIGKIVMPLEKMNVTSGFGNRTMDGKVQGHGAIDLAGKIGDKVMAPISGIARVLSEKESGGYGNMVEVTDEKTGVKHMLAHLDKSMVKTGEVIKAGQQIGTLGNTGKSTGAHLHHEMRDKFGKKIDPTQFYSGPGFGSTAGGAATGNPNIARQGRRAGATQYPAAPDMMSGELGKMSEKYETGGRGSGTVGWDKVGGTSYGKYQIASKVGAMKDFLKFAEQSGRGDVAKKLRDAGAESDTGGTSGKSVDVWKQMAASGELGDLESQFIKQKSFDPAMAGLKDNDLRKRIEGNKALKEMMFSTSVQHGGGGAAGIMNKVYKKGMSDEDLIKATYAERGTRFGGSTAEVQKSVKNRFVSEEKDVMAMLGMPAGNGVPGAAPGAPMVAGAQSGPRTTGSLRSALGLPEGSAGAGAGTGGLMGMLGGMLGLGGSTTGQAGITAGGAPGAIGSDISAITQAMEAQTAATQTAITSGMENLTTQLVDKLGGAGGTNDPAVPTLLGEILAAQRDQTTAINKLIQVSTA